MHIFCDESGNTGTALFDKEQPVFCLASTCISTQVAAELTLPVRRKGQVEAKYAKLRGTSKGRRQLIEFFSSPDLVKEKCKFTMYDKKFYLITHLIDKLIEPPLHEIGVDLYANDAHVNLARVWHYAGFTIFINGYWDKILDAFLRAVRRRDSESFSNFDRTLEQAAQNIAYGSEDFAMGLLVSKGRLQEFIGVYTDVEAFDPACDAFATLVQAWMDEVPGMFRVTHDRSKPMKRNEHFLRTLMRPLPARQIGFSNRQGELPLRVSQFEFADSAENPQIQVADLIAGAAIDCLLSWSGRRVSSEYHERMRETRLSDLFTGGILPSPTIDKAADPLPGERNLVDGTTEFLREAGYFERGKD